MTPSPKNYLHQKNHTSDTCALSIKNHNHKDNKNKPSKPRLQQDGIHNRKKQGLRQMERGINVVCFVPGPTLEYQSSNPKEKPMRISTMCTVSP